MALKIIVTLTIDATLGLIPFGFKLKDSTNAVLSSFNNNVTTWGPMGLPWVISSYKAIIDIELGQDGIIFTSETVGNQLIYYIGSNSTTEILTDVINSTEAVVTSQAYTFPVGTILTTRNDEVILSRSPWFFKESPTIIYDQMRFDLYIYRGEKTTDKPTLPTFQASKFVVQIGQPTISIDIHKLVNDFTQNEYLENITTGVITTNQKDSVWIFIDAGIYLDGVLKYSINQNLLALDGFGYHKELANPLLNKKVLSIIDKHIVYNNSKYFLYFLSAGLTNITINGVVVPFTLDANFNNQFIAGVDVMQYASTSTNFNAVFIYGAETITHNIDIKTECRNSLVNVTFKNKYGVYQKIPFAKLSKKTLDVESESYMPLVSNFGGYDLNKHNKKSYLTNGKEKIICNTDFIPESYNALFKELMLSEQIYLEENNEFLPVNITKKSFNYKTVLNDKLIQYNFEFDYSYNEINNVL